MNAFFAEFFGTAMIIVFGGGVVSNVVLKNTKGNNSGWIVITFGWAVGAFTGVLIAGANSPGPAQAGDRKNRITGKKINDLFTKPYLDAVQIWEDSFFIKYCISLKYLPHTVVLLTNGIYNRIVSNSC